MLCMEMFSKVLWPLRAWFVLYPMAWIWSSVVVRKVLVLVFVLVEIEGDGLIAFSNTSISLESSGDWDLEVSPESEVVFDFRDDLNIPIVLASTYYLKLGFGLNIQVLYKLRGRFFFIKYQINIWNPLHIIYPCPSDSIDEVPQSIVVSSRSAAPCDSGSDDVIGRKLTTHILQFAADEA